MTVQEYNNEFLPKIDRASSIITRMELAIEHMDIGDPGRKEVRRILALFNWSEEAKETILTALEYYREKEGIEKLE